MAYDFKKADPLLYNPKPSPGLLRVPCMPFLSVDGSGDPNTPGGAYQRAVEALYAVAYTLRMSPKAGYLMDGYFSYVVPPLEGFWRMADADCAIDYANKQNFQWTSMIRLPDFVTNEDVDWAKREVEQKKGLDSSLVSRRVLDEGLCAQILHPGSFDDEPETVARLNAFILDSGHLPDFSDSRRHHEIYLSDPRKVAPEKRRTVIRHPIRPK